MISVPEVDVIIPVGGSARYLSQALSSALGQTGVRVHVIVVDARGNPESSPLLIPPGVTLVTSPERLVAGGARNLGMTLSQSPFVSFLDDDDLWPPARTRELVSMVQEPLSDIAHGRLEILREPGKSEGLVAPPNGSPALLAGGVLLSRALWEKIGPFDPALRAGEFVDWLTRAQRMGARLVEGDGVSLIRRIHRESSTAVATDNRQDYLKVVKKWMPKNA